MTEPPTICHEAAGVIGVLKPAGLPTQAPPGIDSVERWLRARRPPGHYLGVPHRLDRAVSGVMVFAATPRAARQLSRQFERREVGKSYVALVSEAPLPPVGAEDGLWIDCIAKVPDEPRARIVAAGDPTGREATTRVREIGRTRLADGTPVVMLRLEPQTGRMHQLRVQAADRGMPILGDALYGGATWPDLPAGGDRERPIALHAWRVAFMDPDTRQPVVLSAALPPHWPADCRRLLAAAAGPATTTASPSPHA